MYVFVLYTKMDGEAIWKKKQRITKGLLFSKAALRGLWAVWFFFCVCVCIKIIYK
jgi:hypothetical protein